MILGAQNQPPLVSQCPLGSGQTTEGQLLSQGAGCRLSSRLKAQSGLEPRDKIQSSVFVCFYFVAPPGSAQGLHYAWGSVPASAGGQENQTTWCWGLNPGLKGAKYVLSALNHLPDPQDIIPELFLDNLLGHTNL